MTADTSENAYRCWRLKVRHFLRRRGVPHDALEDATQEVFATVCKQWATFKGQARRETWVLGFVPKIAKKYRRAAPSEAEWAAIQDVETGHDPFEATARHESARVLQRFIENVGDQERALFGMVELQELRVMDAALILGLKRRDAYNLIDRVRCKFEAFTLRHQASDRWRSR
jgi:RNA polymerase sigma factor (sigma-70 family)